MPFLKKKKKKKKKFLLHHRRLGFRVQGIVRQLCRSRAVDASYRWYA